MIQLKVELRPIAVNPQIASVLSVRGVISLSDSSTKPTMCPTTKWLICLR